MTVSSQCASPSPAHAAHAKDLASHLDSLSLSHELDVSEARKLQDQSRDSPHLIPLWIPPAALNTRSEGDGVGRGGEDEEGDVGQGKANTIYRVSHGATYQGEEDEGEARTGRGKDATEEDEEEEGMVLRRYTRASRARARTRTLRHDADT